MLCFSVVLSPTGWISSYSLEIEVGSSNKVSKLMEGFVENTARKLKQKTKRSLSNRVKTIISSLFSIAQ